ncbi:uncharacterized protein [Primulina eburnea]|uniref:uncharacterized protein n=1 Tax=Primulina eburnea TaxID=1245227 RepID=UPI003C6C24FA
MSSRFQVAVLVSAPCYPNAVAWSEENLVAVASGSLVTILNPAKPSGAGCRGVISVLPSKPFSIGVINVGGIDFLSGCLLPMHVSRDTRPCVRSISWSPAVVCLLFAPLGDASNFTAFPSVIFRLNGLRDRFSLWVLVANACGAGYTTMWIDFLSGCLLPMHVVRDTRPCVRSISWSPAGLASNAGCLLAVCTTRGRIKLYRFPFCDFSAKWIEVAAKKLDNVKENNTWEIIPISVSEGTPLKIKECNVQLITAQQYASHNAMLTPLIVAWSPILRTSEDWVSIPHNSSGCCSILATGLKCGLISFWRIDAPESYSIITPELPCKASNGGFLKAHDTCIISICWALYGSEISKPQLLLATGSSNGRVKIWQVNIKELLKSSETVHASFSLLREVTGLAWPFDGLCLYSCSQVPYVYDSCFGLAVSHGSLAIAVVSYSIRPFSYNVIDTPVLKSSSKKFGVCYFQARRFDSDLFNPMYQERTQKAAIEFLWIGGQQLDTSSNICFDIDFGSFPGFPEVELILWEKNILWSLSLCGSFSGLLNIWDIVAALVSFKQSIPNYVEHILQKWLTSYFGSNSGICTMFLSTTFKILPTLSTHVPTNFCDVGCWRPDERPQLEHYISLHEKIVEDDLKFLGAKVAKIKKRRESFEYEEHCSFCSVIVPFESIEYAICSGVKNGNEVDQTHKLHRCSVSMQLCPAKYSCLQEIFLTMFSLMWDTSTKITA